MLTSTWELYNAHRICTRGGGMRREAASLPWPRWHGGGGAADAAHPGTKPKVVSPTYPHTDRRVLTGSMPSGPGGMELS